MGFAPLQHASSSEKVSEDPSFSSDGAVVFHPRHVLYQRLLLWRVGEVLLIGGFHFSLIFLWCTVSSRSKSNTPGRIKERALYMFRLSGCLLRDVMQQMFSVSTPLTRSVFLPGIILTETSIVGRSAYSYLQKRRKVVSNPPAVFGGAL